jgi:hypothetical protein
MPTLYLSDAIEPSYLGWSEKECTRNKEPDYLAKMKDIHGSISRSWSSLELGFLFICL